MTAAWINIRRSDPSGEGCACAPVHAKTSAPAPGIAGGTPFSRLLARMPRLAPATSSRDDYHRWLDEQGLGADPDGLWYDDLAELMARNPVPAAEAPRADDLGEPNLGALASDIDSTRTEPSTTAPRAAGVALLARPRIETTAAASRFVEWVRLASRCGTYQSREFTELCEEFFAAEDLQPIADNVFRPALEALPDDIIKSRSNYQGRGRPRQRHYKWTVLEAAETTETVPPWDELPEPQRRVA